VKKTLLPALAAATAAALSGPPSADAHRLYERGWWKGKTAAEIAEGQRAAIQHSRAVIRFFRADPEIAGPKRDRALRWHRTHLRMTKHALAEKVAEIEAARRAAAVAAAAAAQAAAAQQTAAASGATAGAGGYASQATALCESGGNPAAVSANGTYRGKWQFDQQTWNAHAPAGWAGVDPAAAPESVQDQAAANVPYDAWPNC
jgi:Transglycosylase-like domain